MFSPLHRELGVEPGPFTWDLVESAVAQKVVEAADLDWKQSVYDSQNPHWQDEAAKDIAAMANSGGGWIVLGVAESKATSAAIEIKPVAWDAEGERRIRQAAYARVGPPVVGLEIIPVEGEGGHVVVLRVPDSPDAPHFARRGQNAFVAPRRNGSHTVFMSDREIERAFRSRFQQSEDRERHLQALFEEAALPLDTTEGATFVVAATPLEPARNPSPIDDREAWTMFHQTFVGGLIEPGRASPWTWANGDLRRGLRRWTMRETHAAGVYAKSVSDDGTVLTAHRLGNLYDEEKHRSYYPIGRPNDSMSNHIEHALVDAVALIRTHARSRDVHGGYRVRIGLVGNPSLPLYIRTTESSGLNFLLGLENAVPIRRFHPITFDLEPLDSVEENLPVVRSAALDVINQGGVRYMQVLAG